MTVYLLARGTRVEGLFRTLEAAQAYVPGVTWTAAPPNRWVADSSEGEWVISARPVHESTPDPKGHA